MSLATVNPAAVLGPLLGRDFSPSLEIVKKLLEGSLPGLPRFGFPLVDSRDIADLHLRALVAPQAAGERFIGGGAFYWMADVARVLKEALGARARKVPTASVPDIVVRLLANFDPVTRSVTFELGRQRGVDSSKAQTMLGWRPRPYRDSIIDCAESLLAAGIIKNT
jgi:dihydroflavonol-4-reductase